MITLIRLFLFITFLPTLLAASPPRLLAWNHDIAARKLALVSGKELTLIQDLSSLRRTAPVQIKATGPLLIRALDKETGTDGKPIEVVCQIPETMEKPLIVLLPDQNNPTGLRFLIVDDNPDGFHWGTYRFLNATSSWLLGGCFLREAPEGAIGSDRRAGKWGLRGKRGRKRCFGVSVGGVSVRKIPSPRR